MEDGEILNSGGKNFRLSPWSPWDIGKMLAGYILMIPKPMPINAFS